MPWTTLNFGKHRGKALPQVLFSDPYWFFWAIKNDKFKQYGFPEEEALEIYNKAIKIRIPPKLGKDMVAEYIYHPDAGKFVRLRIVGKDEPNEDGDLTICREVINLSIPEDKTGFRFLLQSVKFILFEDSSYKMTKKRCEAFFENNKNFIYP